MHRFEVVEPAALDVVNEGHAAKEYWGNLGVQPHYGRQEHWNAFVAEQVLALKPRSVLELGCNVGRNLAAIRERAPELQLAGVDINAAAIAVGVAEGLPLFEADEQFLARQPTGAFDVIFTVSVLDHIASPDLVLAEMLRVSAIGVLMLEPWIGREGKIIRSPDPEGGMVDTTPYSYSWDYDSMLARVPHRLAVTSEPYPLTDQRLAAHYHLWRAIHRHPRRALVRALRRRPVLPSTG